MVLLNDAAHELGDGPAGAVRERAELQTTLLERHSFKARARGACQYNQLSLERRVLHAFAFLAAFFAGTLDS